MDTTLILIGVGCIIGAIIGGGVKLVQVELAQVSSLWRQSMLGAFGVILVLSGLLAGGHIGLPGANRAVAALPSGESTGSAVPAEPERVVASTPTATPPTPTPTPEPDQPSAPQVAAVEDTPPQQQEAVVALPGKVDIFWCETDTDEGAAHRTAAERIAPALRDTGAIGRVRVRPLAQATNARSDYGIHADIVRFDPGERPAAAAIARLATNASGTDFAAAPALPGTPSVDYLSVFVCSRS